MEAGSEPASDSVKPNQPVILQPNSGGSNIFLAEQVLNLRIPLVEIHILMCKTMIHYIDIVLDHACLVLFAYEHF